jgi:hypothetical protein
MSMSGLVLAFIRGWSYTLALLGTAPILIFGGACMTSAIKKGVFAKLGAYAQSGGYAEQCLTAIKVVVAFG